MFGDQIFANLALLLACYGYIILVILVSGKISGLFQVSPKSARKFLHVMIGNLPFVIPFFSYNSFPLNFPFFVAAPFILVTLLASPHSPSKHVSEKLRGLSNLTEKGHSLGLFFYAVSYTILAAVFSYQPQVIAAGILPMAYGDASAALIGEKYGKRRYRILASKSLEGSMTMFMVSFVSLVISLPFFSDSYYFVYNDAIFTSLCVASAAVIVENISPLGSDNLTVPILSSLTLLILRGGF